MKLDDVRIGVRSGDGIVARLPGVVLVVPFGGAAVDQGAVDRLLEECGKGPVAGRLDDLRRAAEGGVPSFALIGEVGGGLAVFVSGDVDAAIAGGDPVLRLSGTDRGGWGVLVPEGFTTLDVGRADGSSLDPRLDLRDGVVAGAGVVLTPAMRTTAMTAPAQEPMVAAAPMAPITAPAPMAAPVAMAPAPEPMAAAMTAALVAQPVAEPVSAPTPAPVATPAMAPAMAPAAVPAPVPVPMATAPEPMAAPMAAPAPLAAPPPPAAAAPAQPAPVEVWGIRCKKGHFNDPEARYCGICGIHMVQDKVARVKGPRPVLGFLVLDDGTSYKLDTDYVLGSDPHGHEAVVGGQARPLVVRADGDVISAVHARVVLKDWDVFISDCGSLYGTYVWSPGGTEWERLATDQQVRLGAGSQVIVAQRGFMFQPVNKR